MYKLASLSVFVMEASLHKSVIAVLASYYVALIFVAIAYDC